ncbi:MAG TPA: AAA family ATPase, partial [Novosphingobium sp.]
AIEGFLHSEARNGRRCLLVVDEAQNLAIDALEELRMLSNFQLGAQPLLQTLLLGQPEFRDLLQTSPALEQLRQRVIAVHHLDAMEPDEVQPYVEHRLRLVGWNGRPSLDPALFPPLHRASGGVPRRVNQIANRLFVMGAVEQLDHFDATLLEAVLAELAQDTTPSVDAEPARTVATPATAPAQPAYHDDWISADEMNAALAKRDALIAELQQAVIELATQAEQRPVLPTGGDPLVQADLAALSHRLDAIERRLVEQEATVKHTLAMLVEWLESDQQAAA